MKTIFSLTLKIKILVFGKVKVHHPTKVMGNDLSRGLFPAKEVKLLVVDEAHKAQGDYAYCQVARYCVASLPS